MAIPYIDIWRKPISNVRKIIASLLCNLLLEIASASIIYLSHTIGYIMYMYIIPNKNFIALAQNKSMFESFSLITSVSGITYVSLLLFVPIIYTFYTVSGARQNHDNSIAPYAIGLVGSNLDDL